MQEGEGMETTDWETLILILMLMLPIIHMRR